ncbi:MAG: hypothetical protein E6R07_02025 [Nevskiaceae bacterium]|nr:MAG: hypothetical protein E6R07_02025 [Nevskiaceae bacterium]
MRRAAFALVLTLASAGICAQEEEPTTHPPAPPQTPRPALLAPKSLHARLLDIALAGSRMVAVGEQGVIIHSDDGKHWQQSRSPVNVMLTRVRFSDAQHGWVLGYSGSILQTSDGGMTWTLRHFDPQSHALYDVLFLDAQRGLAVGAYGTVLESSDGGATWNPGAAALADQRLHLNAVLRLADGTLLVVGEHGLLARSRDAGASWQALHSPYIGSFFGAIARGAKGVLAFGMRGHVYETADLAACPATDIAHWDPDGQQAADTPQAAAALGWHRVENPSNESLFGVLPLKDDGLLFVGINGTALKQAASGAALTVVKTPAVETLVHAVDYQGRVIAVGRQGVQDLGALP